MPRLASSLTTRTRRARPSEKTASRVVPDLSPLGCPCQARPRLGGAGSARPQTRLCLHRGIAPLGHRALVFPRWLCYASACVRPVFAGAETAPLRENRPPRHVYQQNHPAATRALLGYPMHLGCITSPVPPFFASANTSSHKRKPLEQASWAPQVQLRRSKRRVSLSRFPGTACPGCSGLFVPCPTRKRS